MSARADASPARALAWLYCPPAQRALLGALFSLEAEIRTGVDGSLAHEVAHTRLNWWREECARLAAGTPQHPLTRELAAAGAALERELLGGVAGLVDVASWDLAQATFGTRRELKAYCERWSVALVLPWAHSAVPAIATAHVLPLGSALKELELLRTVQPDARAGRVRVPLDELERAGILPAALTAATPGEPLRALLSSAHARAQLELAQAAAALTPLEQPPLRALLVWAQMALISSRRASESLPRPTLAGDHPAPLDGWRAWRAARRAATGRLHL